MKIIKTKIWSFDLISHALPSKQNGGRSVMSVSSCLMNCVDSIDNHHEVLVVGSFTIVKFD